jgi:hypothetical protein
MSIISSVKLTAKEYNPTSPIVFKAFIKKISERITKNPNKPVRNALNPRYTLFLNKFQ